MIGVLVFAVASLLGGFAQTEGLLIGARVAAGRRRRNRLPHRPLTDHHDFPAGPARNRAMGVYAAMSGAGAAVGLILGGALTEYSWRWTLFINVPIGLLVAFLAPRFLAESEPGKGRSTSPARSSAPPAWPPGLRPHPRGPDSGRADHPHHARRRCRHARHLLVVETRSTHAAHADPHPRRPHPRTSFAVC